MVGVSLGDLWAWAYLHLVGAHGWLGFVHMHGCKGSRMARIQASPIYNGHRGDGDQIIIPPS